MAKTKVKLISLLCLLLVAWVLLLIPLRVIAYGYLPVDDALRHAAKVVSGKDWSEILVLRDDVTMDSHPGWHAVLSFVRRLTGWGTDRLVVFSVVGLFLAFSLVPLFFLRRPEAWVAVLLIAMLTNPAFIMRLFAGRPYIFTMAVVLVLCAIWQKLDEAKIHRGGALALTILIAFATWIHASWYLFALPVSCFFLARRWRAAFRIAACAVIGIIAGALLTGSPLVFLKQTFMHAVRAFSNHDLERMLVVEFQPFAGNTLAVIAVIALLAWRKMEGMQKRKISENPVFLLGCSGWVLGFVSIRFWTDWGAPALALWMATELNEILEKKIHILSAGRLILSLVLSGTLYIGLTSDVGSRWTRNLNIEYITLDNAEHRKWMPDAGGILYSDDMRLFYNTFYKNPHANWRYILGFEPTIMPPEDLKIFRNIQWNFAAPEAFMPWVKKMRPEDRLAVRGTKARPPGIEGLEWHYIISGTWIGRLKR